MNLEPLVSGWLPPSRENWQWVMNTWQIAFPILGSLQWIIPWYGMGKTSVVSRLNLPGKWAWMTMEAPGFITLLYIMNSLPRMNGILDLPWQNKVLAGLFVIHYSYRAIIFPWIAPSMAPLHLFVWALALCFQLCNAISLGGWLAAYGPTTAEAWASQPASTARFVAGVLIFYVGLAANWFHDEELREVRRRERRRQQKQQQERRPGSGATFEKHYQIPQAGLFRYILYAHYLCEWVEWAGFWLACGLGCAPARMFLINEILSMAPRAVRGKWWYLDRFGAEKIGRRWAILPGIY